MSGIYTITCLVNKKVYVGYTTNFKKRKTKHFYSLRSGKHVNKKLQAAWNKYREKSFSFEILEEYPEDLLVAMEHYWCTILNARDKNHGYNLKETNPLENTYKHSDASLKKMKNVSFQHTDSAKKKMSIAGKGRKQSSEHIESRMKSHRGAKRSDETRKKMSESKNKKIEKCNMSGIKVAEFKNIYDAAESVNLTYHAIWKCINGNNKSAGGFIFKALEEKL